MREREREIFHLTMHWTHFIYGYMVSDIWLRTILIVRKENPLLPHRLLFPINSKGSFICNIPHKGYTYHSLCYTSRGALAGTGKIAQWVHPMKDRSDNPSHHEPTLLPRSYMGLTRDRLYNLFWPNLSEELFEELCRPAFMQIPVFGWVADVCAMQHQWHCFWFVNTGKN